MKRNRNRRRSTNTRARPFPDKKFIDNTYEEIAKLPKSMLMTLNYLIGFDTTHDRMYMSQSTIAERVECSRETVNRNVCILGQHRLLNAHYRHFDTCIYTLPLFFKDFKIKKLLSSLLPALLLALPLDLTQLVNNSPLDALFRNTLYATTSESKKNGLQKGKKYGNSRKPISNDLPQLCPQVDITKREKMIDSIQELSITNYGRAWLACFSSKIISESHADTIKFATKIARIDNPYGFLYNRCISRAKLQHETPNWDVFRYLKKKYNFSQYDKPTENNKICIKKPTKGAYAIWKAPEYLKKPTPKEDTMHTVCGYNKKILPKKPFYKPNTYLNCSSTYEELKQQLEKSRLALNSPNPSPFWISDEIYFKRHLGLILELERKIAEIETNKE